MSIKYIVLEGGGYMGVSAFGTLAELHKAQFYNIEDIKGIYGTSIGGLIGAILCLKIDWSTVLNYIQDRPWHKIVSFAPNMILESISKKGIFDISFFQKSLKNLLESVDLNIEITLRELYEYSNIELHIYATEVNSFTLTDFSYKTTPNMKLVEAIYKSSTLPFIFQPMWYNNSYYLDGGLINNYPINMCIKDGANPEEIIGVQYNISAENDRLKKETHILDFAFYLYKKFFRMLRLDNNIILPFEIIIPHDGVSISECRHLLENTAQRQKYIKRGTEAAKSFLANKEIK